MPDRIEPASEGNADEVKSIRRLFSILELLKINDGMGVTEIADEMNMSKGAIHRYLNTLVNIGYAVNDEGTYELGLRFLDFGTYVRDKYPFSQYIEPNVRQLAEETGERAQYMAQEHGKAIYLFRDRGMNAVQTDARVGKIEYLHSTAAGKAILSEIPRERVDDIIETYGLVARTEQTITDCEALYEELDQIRDRGYALNQEEHITGLWAVGVPIIGPDGDVIGGLSVSGPADRVRSRIEDETLQSTLLGTANEIELNLSYS
jgi:DNA-binding IclR family transcriptional regulator